MACALHPLEGQARGRDHSAAETNRARRFYGGAWADRKAGHRHPGERRRHPERVDVRTTNRIPRRSAAQPRRRSQYFRPFAGRPRDVHIHVCDAGSEWERRHPLFVAYLRADAAAREGYMEAKQSALARWADDRIAYTESKDEVIRNLMVRAESWARVEGWSL